MSLANIQNLTANMTNPDTIIKSMDVTGSWGEFFLYGLFLTITFALSSHLDKFSKRVSVAGVICFILAVPMYAMSIDGYRLISQVTLLRILFVMVLSLVWLFIDTQKQETN